MTQCQGQECIGLVTYPLPLKLARSISQQALGSQEVKEDAFGCGGLGAWGSSSGPPADPQA